MITIDITQINYSEIIIETINNLFSTLFSSIDNSIYSLIDKIVFVDDTILDDSFFDALLSSKYGLISIANSIMIGLVTYYCFRLMFAYYVGSNIERPYHFLSKVIICTICINFTPFLCKQILNINSLISGSICEIGYSIFSKEISFNNMIVHTNSYINNNSLNIFSFSGLLKSFITFGLINLLFSYSIRYILIKIFILITPFAILSLINSTSSWFFKSWFRNFISLLLVQSLIALVLLIIFSLDSYSDSILSQIIYISAIFVLTKANHYMKELFGGLTTDFNMNLSSLKNLIK